MSLHDPSRTIRLLVSIGAACCLSILIMACTNTDDGPSTDEGPSPTQLRDDSASTQSETSQPSSQPSNRSQAQHPPADWDEKPDGHEWTDIAHTAIDDLGSELLMATPRDVQNYCPSYDDLNQEQRRAFWVYLLSRLARFESSHDPSVSYTESFNDAQGNPVISRGLLQLSKESANGYGCGIGDANELHDPETNIRCGVRILNRWVAERDGVIAARTNGQWRGAARYWSPFRDDSKREQIASATASQPYCQ